MTISSIGNNKLKLIKDASDSANSKKAELVKINDESKPAKPELTKISDESKPGKHELAKINDDSKPDLAIITTSDSKTPNAPSEELKASMKDYGVAITAENAKTAAEYAKQLPEWAKNDTELIALMTAKKLPIEMLKTASDYLKGKLRFDNLFAAMDKSTFEGMKKAWGEGQMLDMLRKIIAEGIGGNKELGQKLALVTENFASDLVFQEVMSKLPGIAGEGQIFFQWPLFWHGSDVPDTLEGEAFVPGNDNLENGFSLKLMVNPPTLGQISVNINSLKRKLWVKFSVEELSMGPIKTIIQPLRDNILNTSDFDFVDISVKSAEPVKNFFVLPKAKEEKSSRVKPVLDLKA